jgi:hypothetical protein
MPNAWIEFVKDYAKKNDITYGCAISEAKDAYKAHKAGKSIPEKKMEPVKQKVMEPVKEKVMEPVKAKVIEPVKEKVIESVKEKVMKTPKIIQNAVISKKEKKAILDELTTNLNALKKQQTRMPSQSRFLEIGRLEKRIMEVAGI